MRVVTLSTEGGNDNLVVLINDEFTDEVLLCMGLLPALLQVTVVMLISCTLVVAILIGSLYILGFNRLYLFTCFSKSAFPLLVIQYSFKQVLLSEVGPMNVSKI